MKCATHPGVETNLRCSKCGKLICPKCMVQTPVGARCPDCARLYKLPTYSVSTQYYLRAVGAGLGMAIICGIVWGLIEWLTPIFSFNLLLAPGAGYAIGEVASLSVNRKRGTRLAIVAGIAVVISYLFSIMTVSIITSGPFLWRFFLSPFNTVFDLTAIALGVFIAVTRLR